MIDILAQLASGFVHCLTPLNLAMLVVGIVIGLLIGVLPGLTLVMGVALALPFTYKMDVTASIVLLTAMYVSGTYGGAFTAILFRIPGEPIDVPMLWDGYTMGRKGKPGRYTQRYDRDARLRALVRGPPFFFQESELRQVPTKAMSAENVSTNANMAPSTRNRLIEAGLELMRRQGYGATGLNEILETARVPKGSFYHYFGSKEEFTAAVIERYAVLAGVRFEEALSNTRLAPLKRLRRYFEELVGIAGQAAPIQGCLLGDLSLEVADASPLLQGFLSSSFTRWQASVAAVLREAVEKGDLPRSTRPEALAGFLLNSWEGALLRSQADKSDAPLKDFLHYVFEELLGK